MSDTRLIASLRKKNVELECALKLLHELHEPDAEGKPSIRWFSPEEIKRRAEVARKVLGIKAAPKVVLKRSGQIVVDGEVVGRYQRLSYGTYEYVIGGQKSHAHNKRNIVSAALAIQQGEAE